MIGETYATSSRQRSEAVSERRYKLRFPSADALNAALAIEIGGAAPVVVNEKRRSASFPVPGQSAAASPHSTASAEAAIDGLAREFGAEVFEDYRYELDADLLSSDLFEMEAEVADASLDDVLAAVRTEEAWRVSRGEGVMIAIVDTGVHAGHPEFPIWKREAGWSVPGEDPWTDQQGHGTMCACIAAATRSDGGSYDGVAPDATIMSCKTSFFDTELGAIYDVLAALAGEGRRVVASNSFGRRVGAPPPPPQNSDFIPALGDALAAGVLVVFSAGNNHQLANGAPSACDPNSIWLHKSRADVLAVATCDLEEDMWYYSSRGPGQHFGDPGTNEKPDLTAPTPRNGRILYGAGEKVLSNGWGTSGACPQVAGLAALLLGADPGLSRQQIFAAITSGARPLNHGRFCEGSGMMDAAAALRITRPGV